jgi:hypothetical protein
MKNSTRIGAVVVLIAGLFCAPDVNARNLAAISGTVIGPDGSALAGVRMALSTPDGVLTAEALTNARGAFGIAGLSQGRYLISCRPGGEGPLSTGPVDIGGFETVFIRMRVLPPGTQEGLVVEYLSRDPGSLSSATTIDADQMRLLPSGGSVWSLIENQDLSATIDRIDVGGLRSDLPALFSARGGTSWTQNEYRLNGMSITDPYDGGLPFYVPDLFGFQTARLENAGHSAGTLSPGGTLDLVTRDGRDSLQGSFSAFAGDRRLVGSNITPALEKEGILEADTLKSSQDLHFDLSGPIVPGKLFFLTSFEALRVVRDPAEFAEDDKGAVTSGLFRLRYEAGRSSWSFLWAGQIAKNSAAGAGRRVPFVSTLDRKNTANILQAEGQFRLAPGHVLAAGAGFNRADLSSRFQEGASGQAGIDLLGGISGPSAGAGNSRRELLTAFLRGDLSAMSGRMSHRLEYGTEFRRASASTRPDVADGVLLRFFDGVPYEVVRFTAPAEHRETSLEGAAFIQETLTFPNLVAVSLGAHASYTRARAGARSSAIDWLHVAPRLGCVLPLTRSGRASLRLFAGRYYHSLPLSWLAYGNPNAPGGLVHAWTDANGDGIFENDEAGALVRREGPFFAAIDPDLKRPRTDELSIGISHKSACGFSIGLTGFVRRTRDLVETLNTGVPFASYSPREVTDIGDDRVSGNYDDLTFTLFEQDAGTLGQDFALLTNPGGDARYSRYEGLDLVLMKRTSSRFGFFVSLTAMQCVGTTSPGNSARENDDGIVGSLYDNPNTLINARGRLRFDRAYTGRIGFALRLPFGIRLGYILKYWDGQPFAREIAVTGFRQGPFLIMAHPRGVARYEFNMTNDVRVQKEFAAGPGVLRLILDGYNIFNQHLATAEDARTRPEFPLRYATEIQSPRTFRFGVSYDF